METKHIDNYLIFAWLPNNYTCLSAAFNTASIIRFQARLSARVLWNKTIPTELKTVLDRRKEKIVEFEFWNAHVVWQLVRHKHEPNDTRLEAYRTSRLSWLDIIGSKGLSLRYKTSGEVNTLVHLWFLLYCPLVRVLLSNIVSKVGVKTWETNPREEIPIAFLGATSLPPPLLFPFHPSVRIKTLIVRWGGGGAARVCSTG